MEAEIPAGFTYGFYALVAWGLSAVLVSFRILADTDKVGIALRIGAMAWLGVPAVLASSGVLADFDAIPPLLLRLLVPMALSILGFCLSPLGRRVALRLPITLLVGTQLLRLPLELLLYGLAARGELPEEMTLAGYNYDIYTGVSAGILWVLLRRGEVPRSMLLLWNSLGLLLLIVVVSVAILAYPEPFGWFSPDNRLVAYYPWVWIPTFLVPVALLSHLLVFRKLFAAEDD